MAQDRYIYWDTAPGPSINEIEAVVEDYLGAFLKSPLRWELWTLQVELVGECSHPLRRIDSAPGATDALLAVAKEPWMPPNTRRIEIYVETDEDKPDCIDVMTRMQDKATDRLADGLAEIIASTWRGIRG
jgi:hypothetical protein